jgi:hypothetical protein
MPDEFTVSSSSDQPEKRRVPKVRSIACTEHAWQPVFAEPKKDKDLQAEYRTSEWADFQRCEICQRISRKRWDWSNYQGKHYTGKPKVFSLEDSLEMMTRTVYPWNERVAESENARPIALVFGKIVLDFASADDQPLCDGTPAVETDPEGQRFRPQHLRVDHEIKDRLYETARQFYRDLDGEDEDDLDAG